MSTTKGKWRELWSYLPGDIESDLGAQGKLL